MGVSLFLDGVVLPLFTGQLVWLLMGIVAAYGFARVGHFFVEHNRPATFHHPWLSLLGDSRLCAYLWRGRENF